MVLAAPHRIPHQYSVMTIWLSAACGVDGAGRTQLCFHCGTVSLPDSGWFCAFITCRTISPYSTKMDNVHDEVGDTELECIGCLLGRGGYICSSLSRFRRNPQSVNPTT